MYVCMNTTNIKKFAYNTIFDNFRCKWVGQKKKNIHTHRSSTFLFFYLKIHKNHKELLELYTKLLELYTKSLELYIPQLRIYKKSLKYAYVNLNYT